MVGSRDLPASNASFLSVFINNQFRAKTQWPAPGTSLEGKTAIVTGSNTGLGYESARQLLGLNLSTLIVAVRSLERGESAAKKLRALFPKATITVFQLDMCSYESIQAFVQRVDKELPRVEMVILNAGGLRLSYETVEATGHEWDFQVNYLSTVLLTVLLLPVLKAKKANSQPSHIAIVNAALSLVAKFPFKAADPIFPGIDDKKIWDVQEAYHSSKALMHMFIWKVVDYVSADDVIVSTVDPAWVKGTELNRDAKGALKVAAKAFAVLTGRPTEVGASCFVDAVVNKGKESHGCFLMSWQPHSFNAYLYTPEGKVVTDRVWKETMADLEFAHVLGILESIKA